MSTPTLGTLVHEFFVSHLVEQKGLRKSSVRSYRDTLRLFLQFVAADVRRNVSQLTPEELSFERVLAFLRHLEQQRRNSITTRNQRLAALHTFFEFVARRDPDRLHECQRISMIPVKRSAQPAMRSLTREEVQALFAGLPCGGRHTLRDRALLLFLYNTGARVQEVADLRIEQLALGRPSHVNLSTTNRYAEITTRMKAEAIRLCEIPATGARHTGPAAWRGDTSLLDWLGSL